MEEASPLSQYNEFRSIVGEWAESRIKHFPELARRDPLIQEYQSFDLFVDRYPTYKDREQMIRMAAGIRNSVRISTEVLDGIIRNISDYEMD
jgi:hypothetical protein